MHFENISTESSLSDKSFSFVSFENPMNHTSTNTFHQRTNTDTSAGRPLTIRHGSISERDLTLFIPLDLWATAERLRESFGSFMDLNYYKKDGAQNTSILWSQYELALLLLQYLHSIIGQTSDNNSIKGKSLALLHVIFIEYIGKFFEAGSLDPHALILFKGAKHKESVLMLESGIISTSKALRIHYDVRTTLRNCGYLNLHARDHQLNSSLLCAADERRAKLAAIFGGQGNTEDYLGEIIEIDAAYHPLIAQMLSAVLPGLLEVSQDPEATDILPKGIIDVQKWIDYPDTRPPRDHLVAAPVSLPLVGLIQLLNLWVMMQVLDISPWQLKQIFMSTTGHSQGIISAVVLASNFENNDESIDCFLQSCKRALQLLFWIGVRAQQTHPQTSLAPQALNDSINNDEGIPTPMLAISNLTYDQLKMHVDRTNEHLPLDRRIEIALFNGPRNFVCSGPQASLYGLNRSLRKVKLSGNTNEGKVPYSQRKLRFSTRFLPISTPFHCSYQQQAVNMIMGDVNRYKLHFSSRDLVLPVISTSDGKILY